MSKSPFADLTTDGLQEAEDRLGGGFKLRESDIYTGVIKAFYSGKSTGGAHCVTVIFAEGEREYRETIYITNKKGENWFPNRDNPKIKVPMPGFTIINDICLATTGQALADQDWEEKTIKLWDKDAGKELPKAVDMAVDVIGKEVSLGILKELHNKSEKQNDGSYEDTYETIEKNAINKVFHTESKMTMAEALAQKEEAEFWDKWIKQNQGQVPDRRKLKGEGGGTKTTKPAPKSGDDEGTPARKPLFGKK